MKKLRIIVPLLFLILGYACTDELNYDAKKQADNSDSSAELSNCDINRGVKIAILSDVHYMDPSLLVKDGPAFQAYLAKDPKLLEYSSEILRAAVRDIIRKRPDLVLISGDLTKDGERISHERVASILRQFTMHGIKVVVTVGNHDVNNPEAERYIDDKTVPVPYVQADRIPFIYANCGFRNAIARDPNSLSYVNEPLRGLWIITIDANRYYDNTTKSTTPGVIKPETMTWVLEQLAKAQDRGKTVIGMMHHGLMEHYQGQQQVDPGYVVTNSANDVDALIEAGLKIILTGHYHATDITKKTLDDGKFVFDVETGSTVTYPCTYRMLTIKGDEFSFKSQSTTASMYPGFDDIAKTFSVNHYTDYFTYLLTNMGVPAAYAPTFAPWFKDAAMAHFAGDETPDMTVLPVQMGTLTSIGATDLANALGSFWTDINTTDNNVKINMTTGVAVAQ